MKTFIRSFLTLVLLLSVSALFAQQKEVKGNVVSSDGIPIPSATVRIAGKTTATTTDDGGRFTLMATQGERLEITSVGYEPNLLR